LINKTDDSINYIFADYSFINNWNIIVDKAEEPFMIDAFNLTDHFYSCKKDSSQILKDNEPLNIETSINELL
jgi:hypothetical protein